MYCSLEAESTAHFFLHSHLYHIIRGNFLNSLEVIDTIILKLFEEKSTKVLLYGFVQVDQNQNRNIFYISRKYMVESKHFKSSLF